MDGVRRGDRTDDGPDSHAVDSLLVDFGLAVWNQAVIYPVIDFEQAVSGLPTG